MNPVLIAQTLAIVLVAGILAQVVAERLRVPSIVTLLVIGALLGPEIIGWVDPDVLGWGLDVIVGFSVAIILFEGSLGLEWGFVQSRGRAISRLVSIGALVTFFGASLAAWAILPLDLSFAFLLGSLVVVTGPTVIRPLLKRVRVQRRVGLILESEGVLIDPVGAILAFVVLEAILAPEFSLALGPGSLISRLGIGAVVGAASGLLMGFALRMRWAAEPELVNLAVLSGAIATFVGSNAIQTESGLMAVVTSGLVLGSFTVPAKRDVLRFKGVLTTIVISLLFVLLSADIDWMLLTPVLVPGLVWVAVLMFVVRPLCIFVSTHGTDLSTRDKLFLSWISPRGIVAASVAALFAIYLERAGVEGGDLLQPLVFLTIAVTVLFQGLTAGFVARRLFVSAEAYGVVIVGAAALGRTVGLLLKRYGREVALIDSNLRHCARAKELGLPAWNGNSLESENLERIGLRASDQILALTPNSEVNYLVSRLAREEFGVPRSLALEHHDDKPVSEATRASHGIERAFGRGVSDDTYVALRGKPALWVGKVAPGVSATLAEIEIGKGLPLVCLRDGRAEGCGDQTRLEKDDRIVFLGEPDAEWITEAEPLEEERPPAE